jgi:hypothetical protein
MTSFFKKAKTLNEITNKKTRRPMAFLIAKTNIRPNALRNELDPLVGEFSSGCSEISLNPLALT